MREKYMKKSSEQIKNCMLIGSKSLAYGGFETFVKKLIEQHQSSPYIKYHVACKANGSGSMNESLLEGVKPINSKEFEYCNARFFKIRVPEIGGAQAIYYDVKALAECCKYIRKNHIKEAIVYIMACRIGPFMGGYFKRLHKLGATVCVNPDGHEWMRAKWSKPVRLYWKLSERLMVKYSDLIICDSKNIEKYIKDSYEKYHPKTTFIAYGTDVRPSPLADDDERFMGWLESRGLRKGEYYLAVGRFVPENNYETMICEYMRSGSKKDFAIVTTANKAFLDELERRLHFKSDSRIKFVGTLYDEALLKKVRENAYGYLHGHEVGGTNPSLLEALGSTRLNLLLDVGFNREVAEDAALYWNKKKGSLSRLIDRADGMKSEELEAMGQKARERILRKYTWEIIGQKYMAVFCRM